MELLCSVQDFKIVEQSDYLEVLHVTRIYPQSSKNLVQGTGRLHSLRPYSPVLQPSCLEPSVRNSTASLAFDEEDQKGRAKLPPAS